MSRTYAALLSVLLLSCGSNPADPENPEGCAPATCAALNKNCGQVTDGCGGTIDCGGCGAGESCGASGQPNVCGPGTCTPRTCTDQAADCGQLSDGCSALLECGQCTAPETCGGGGPNRCGDGSSCTPRTCADVGANCGALEDGCGGTLNCGSCSEPQSCGGGGSPNICGGECTTHAHCLGFEECIAGACVSECTPYTAPAQVSVDVPRAQVRLRLTLNGQALSSVQGTGLAGTPFIELIDVAQQRAARVQVFSFEGNTEGWTATPVIDMGVYVVPGRYQLVYSAGSELFPGWPQNARSVLDTVEVSSAGGEIVVDVPSIQVSMNPAFNGAALAEQTGSGLAGTPFVELIDADGSLAGRFQMFSFEGNTEGWTARPTASTPIYVLPGSYDAVYTAGTELFPGWPQNTRGLLQSGLTLTQPGTFNINIESITADLNITLNGQALGQLNGTGLAGTPFVELREAGSASVGSARAARFQLFRFEGNTEAWTATPVSPLSVNVLPGRYTAHYATGSEPLPSWPQNTDRQLGLPLEISAPQALNLDVPSVPVTVAVSLNGRGLSAVQGTGLAGTPFIELRDEDGSLASRLQLFTFEGNTEGWTATPAPSPTTYVIPGAYEALYTAGTEPFPGWPRNSARRLMGALQINTSQTLNLDVPSVQLGLQLTLNGQALSSVQGTGLAGTPFIELRDGDGSLAARYQVFSFEGNTEGWTATPAIDGAVFVLPGSYDALYQAGAEPFPNWPGNTSRKLTTELIEQERSLSLDIQSLRVDLRATIAGEPLAQVMGTGLAGSPFLELRDEDDSLCGRYALYGFEGNTEGWTASPNTDLGAYVLPGAYVLRYSAGSEPFPMWPQNTAMPLECAAVSP